MSQDPMLGKVIENYRIERVVGRGGMGTVYEATDLNLNLKVALKIMNPNLAEQERFRLRFQQEAQAAARLDHPNIIRPMYFGIKDRNLFLVTELIQAGSLADYLKRLRRENKVIELPEALELTRQVADALHYAHQQRMVHRDVKPGNILLKPMTSSGRHTSFRAVLTDFGLAQMMESTSQSMRGQPAGTFAYMSPEQCKGVQLDGRSDIYSLGIMLYELATGRLPFAEPKSLREAFEAHMNQQPVPPSSVRPDIPRDVERIILKCIAKKPEQRFQSAGELSQALQNALISLPKAEMSRPLTPPDQVDSLATYVISQAGPISAPSLTAPPPMGSNDFGDRIVVYAPKEGPRVEVITRDTITIGRDEACDIRINDPKSSRQHVRVIRGRDGRFTVTDLGSTNGTWIETTQLAANQPQVWMPGQRVRIGYTWLKLESTAAPRSQPVGPVTVRHEPQPQPSAMGVTVGGRATLDRSSQVSSGDIAVTFTPTNVQVEAGSRAGAVVEVLNQSENVARVILQITDMPADWYTITNGDMNLMPGERGTANISFFPPRSSASLAGQHVFWLRASVQHNNDAVRMRCTLEIAPYYNFTADMQPVRLRNYALTTLRVTNTGNIQDEYSIVGRDREQALTFGMAKDKLVLLPGQYEQLPVTVRPTRRHWFGAWRTYPFEIAIDDSQEASKPQVLAGELISSPVIPAWLIGVLALAVIACCAVTLFAISTFNAQQASATQTEAAAQTAGFNASVGTATGQAVQDAATATAQANQAATATSIGASTQQANDNDGDGLTNQEEAQLGTDPNKADTDQDGLPDGIEVKLYNTNPKLPDTDGDGLIDGEEVRRGTLPTIADSDGDGLPDGIDPQPLIPNSATLQPTPVCQGVAPAPGPLVATVSVNSARVVSAPTGTSAFVSRVELGRVVRATGRDASAQFVRLDSLQTRWVSRLELALSGDLCSLPDKTSEQNVGVVGGALAYGVSTTGSVADEYGQGWAIQVNGVVSRITIRMDGGFDTYLLLFDPNGLLVAQNDNAAVNPLTSSEITFDVVTPGIYTAVARSVGGATGSYTIQVTLVSGPG